MGSTSLPDKLYTNSSQILNKIGISILARSERMELANRIFADLAPHEKFKKLDLEHFDLHSH